MKWFPLRTYVARQGAVRRYEAALLSMQRAVTERNQHRFLMESVEPPKKLRNLVAEAQNYARSRIAALEAGRFDAFEAGKIDKVHEACNARFRDDEADRAELSERQTTLSDMLTRAASLPYDEAKFLYQSCAKLMQEVAFARKKLLQRKVVTRWKTETDVLVSRLADLEVLVRISAEPFQAVEDAARLPLRETEENRRRREALEHLALQVQAARAAGGARKLRESWSEEQRIFRELCRDSEACVRRAEREIESWLSHCDLHPELSTQWAARWHELLSARNTPSFLADWEEAKRELTKQVEAGFREHWGNITTRSRRSASVELSWMDVEGVARQVRKDGMPYVYQKDSN